MKESGKRLMRLLLVNTAVIVPLYFVLAYLQFAYTLWIYLAVGCGLGLWFLIYNRGFVGKNLTPEQLPDSMTPVEKQAFLDDCAARLSKSRWVLTVLLPIILAIFFDIIYLFIFPTLEELF